jgi:hypothetical protein
VSTIAYGLGETAAMGAALANPEVRDVCLLVECLAAALKIPGADLREVDRDLAKTLSEASQSKNPGNREGFLACGF